MQKLSMKIFLWEKICKIAAVKNCRNISYQLSFDSSDMYFMHLVCTVDSLYIADDGKNPQ